MRFLPVSIDELNELGIEQLDFILVTGDAYVDHPSFGIAIISRLLESYGFTVGIIAQPNYKDMNSFAVLGTPRLAFLVSAGNIDSMVNHYTVAKKRRTKDLYSPGGEGGLRPDMATIVYSNKIREKFGEIPIIIGGIEASLRRLSHYDYWENKVKKSILIDSKADLLIYGMGEHQIIEIAEALQSGIPVQEITFVNGTVYKTNDINRVYEHIKLPTYKETSTNKVKYSDSFIIQYENTDNITAKTLVEQYDKTYVVQNIPTSPVTMSEFDRVYGLNYMRSYHHMYEEKGGVPAIEEVKFSVISNRGCFGNCNFCALAFHQGRVVQARSHKSIVKEAEAMVWQDDFKGYIHDVGGPTANFRMASCEKQEKKGVCKNKQCLFPSPCSQLKSDHKDYLGLLRKLREIPKVKKVFVRSGIRYDYLMNDKNNDEFFNELCEHHISGQLKVAPEHVSHKVLARMGKPDIDVFEKFSEKYYAVNEKLGKKQFLVPYLMSSHPGSDLSAAIELAEYLRDKGYQPEQVQDFYPTPGTLSTCIFYTEFDPYTKEKVFVEKSGHGKALQRALMQYRLPQNFDLVMEALKKAGRQDLIGFDQKCLIRPRNKKPNYIREKESFVPKKKKTIRNVHNKKNN